MSYPNVYFQIPAIIYAENIDTPSGIRTFDPNAKVPSLVDVNYISGEQFTKYKDFLIERNKVSPLGLCPINIYP